MTDSIKRRQSFVIGPNIRLKYPNIILNKCFSLNQMMYTCKTHIVGMDIDFKMAICLNKAIQKRQKPNV